MDQGRLQELMDRFVIDFGATGGAGTVLLGERLGLYRALRQGPLLPAELAARTETTPRYVEEWLCGQAAGGYVEYDPETGRYFLTDEQTFVLTDPAGPVYLPGAFQLAVGALQALPSLVTAFRTGAGMGWPEQHPDVFAGCERFFRAGYSAHLVSSWIPALDGALERLVSGCRVADVGCGRGASTLLMAGAFPRSGFIGSDYHDESIRQAGKRAAEAGLADRVRFEVATADAFGGGPFDLVTTFDCLHELGDPLAAARHVRESLAEDGTWMIVEPYAGETVAENLTPVGRVYYSLSTLLCVPGALSQPGGHSLGAQAGEAAIRGIVRAAGFGVFGRVAQTPFQIVYGARP
jgi:SAM-dependent methyltransferase